MNIDKVELDEITAKLKKILPLVQEISKRLEIVIALGGKLEPEIPFEGFVRSTMACKILGINPTKLQRLIAAGKLTPYYIASNQRRFKLTELYALAKTQPWSIEDAGDGPTV